MSLKVCNVPGCPDLTTTGKCTTHTAEQRKASDARRGNAAQRGYGTAHRKFRAAVLRRDPTCVLCGAPSTDADHWPLSRRQLEARGMNPNDPSHGRGLCSTCHKRETARHQPGGWHARGGG